MTDTTTYHEELGRTLWCLCTDRPALVTRLNDTTCRALLAWSDDRRDYDALDADAARYELLRYVAWGDLVIALDAATAWLTSHGYDESDAARYEQLLCAADESRAEEARGMVDDWQARLGLPAELAETLLDCISANEQYHSDGGRV